MNTNTLENNQEKEELKTIEFIKSVASFTTHPKMDVDKLCRHKNCSSCDGCG